MGDIGSEESGSEDILICWCAWANARRVDGTADGGGGNGSERTSHVMDSGRCWRRQEARRCGRSKDSIKEGKALSGDRGWVNKVGSNGGRGRCGGRREKGLQGHFALCAGWRRGLIHRTAIMDSDKYVPSPSSVLLERTY